MKYTKYLFVTCFVCFAFSAMGAGDMPIYTDTANTIEVLSGEEFAVSLKSDQVGGYKWQFAKQLDQSMLNIVNTEYKKPSENGKTGDEIFVFKASGKGTTMISLKYARDGERDMYPLESKVFIVDVK